MKSPAFLQPQKIHLGAVWAATTEATEPRDVEGGGGLDWRGTPNYG